MAKKKNTIPSGFDDILGNIYSNAEEGGGVTDIDDLLEPNVPLVEEEKTDDVPPVKDPEDGKTADQNDDPNAHDDDTKVPEQIDNPEPPVDVPPVEEPKTEEEPTDADVIEA